jgi:hypothetical protein
MLAWSERRHSSWADAAREAELRAASSGHLPQIRGQLRYHFGESALMSAARTANVGAMPMSTQPPGGVFTVARVGKFALVSVTAADSRKTPRRSVTRKLLSQPNQNLDPQGTFFNEHQHIVTDLAYFGCLVTIPNRRDPTAPAELALGVPNANITDWLSWIPFGRLHGLLQQEVDSGSADSRTDGTVADKAFPKFRVPKTDKGEDGQSA